MFYVRMIKKGLKLIKFDTLYRNIARKYFRVFVVGHVLIKIT